MNIPKRKIYGALFEYCAFHSGYRDKRFYLASFYDEVIDFVAFIEKEVGCANSTKIYRAIQRAKSTLLKNNWLYKFQTHADKHYMGEPSYITNYRFTDADIEAYKQAKEENKVEEFLSGIPI